MLLNKKFLSVITGLVLVSVCNAQSQNPDAYYLAIKGGISLGNYETGLNWVLLKHFQGQESGSPQLSSVSGASAGSLNSILSAIDTCLPNERETIEKNILRSSWNIGIDELLPTDGEINGHNEQGIFTRNSFRAKYEELLKRIETPLQKDCNLLITMSITKVEPYRHSIARIDENISLQRFVVPILVSGKRKETIKFRNIDILKMENKLHGEQQNSQPWIPGPYLNLLEHKDDETDDYTIEFKTVFNLAMASSAFPIAFEPVEIPFCFPHKLERGKACEGGRAEIAKFSDGGLFDNSPIGVSLDIAFCDRFPLDRKSCEAKKSRGVNLIYINPDSYRTKSQAARKSVSDNSTLGVWNYGKYFIDSFNTASEQEYRSALVRIKEEESKTVKTTFLMTNRYHNLLADFHSHFGAFYAEEYRYHDYLVGVYDGMYAVSRLVCRERSAGYEEKSCVQEEMLSRISRIAPDTKNDESVRDFLSYLYNSEFNAIVPYVSREPDKNINIILSRAFNYINKTTDKGITYKQYLASLKKAVDVEDLRKHPDLNRILYSGEKYTASKLRKIYANLVKIQKEAGKCINCDEDSKDDPNQQIYAVLEIVKPVAYSAIYHNEKGVWPLAINDSFSINYGFDISQKNQVLSIDYRHVLAPRYSLDLSAGAHYFGRELRNDHYSSLSAGLTYHLSGIVFPTIGIGYERGSEGEKIYKSELSSVYLKGGVMDELVTIKLLRRLDDLEEYSVRTRDEISLVVFFDLSKIARMVF